MEPFFMPCDEMRLLGKSATSVLRILLASAIVSLSPMAAFAGNSTNPPHLVGTYITRAPKTAPTLSVSLGEDGTATVTQDPGQGSTTWFGHWQEEGSQVKVTFDADADTPQVPPMVFQSLHDKLQPITWDHQAWGTAHPPTLTKGYKVKYLFWTTTMR
jgi:hypothetical protein